MVKQKTLILSLACLLGLFIFTLPSDQSDAKDSITSEDIQQGDDSPVDYKSRGRSYFKIGTN